MFAGRPMPSPPQWHRPEEGHEREGWPGRRLNLRTKHPIDPAPSWKFAYSAYLNPPASEPARLTKASKSPPAQPSGPGSDSALESSFHRSKLQPPLVAAGLDW